MQVEVLNGAGVRGLAAQTEQALTALSFKVTGKGDADSSQYERTIIRYTKGQEAAARTLAELPRVRCRPAARERGGSGRRPDHPRPRLHRRCGRRP